MSVACRGLGYGCQDPAVFGIKFVCAHSNLQGVTLRSCAKHADQAWGCGFECHNNMNNHKIHTPHEVVPMNSIDYYMLDKLAPLDVIYHLGGKTDETHHKIVAISGENCVF